MHYADGGGTMHHGTSFACFMLRQGCMSAFCPAGANNAHTWLQSGIPEISDLDRRIK